MILNINMYKRLVSRLMTDVVKKLIENINMYKILVSCLMTDVCVAFLALQLPKLAVLGSPPFSESKGKVKKIWLSHSGARNVHCSFKLRLIYYKFMSP